MKKIFNLKYIFLFKLGLLIGTFFFFPWSSVKEKISSTLQEKAQISLTSSTLKAGTGLALGSHGSLISLIHENAVLETPQGIRLECDRLYLGPRFWPFILGQIQVSIACLNKDAGDLKALSVIKPFWKAEKLSLKAQLKDRNLDFLTPLMGGKSILGKFNGSLELGEMPLKSTRFSAAINWDLKGAEVQTPLLSTPFASIPQLKLGSLNSEGSFQGTQIKIKKLVLGNSKSKIQGEWEIDMDLGRNYQQPKGTWSGWVQIDDDFAKNELSSALNVDITFGPKDKGEKRIFVKELNGSYLPILSKPKE